MRVAETRRHGGAAGHLQVLLGEELPASRDRADSTQLDAGIEREPAVAQLDAYGRGLRWMRAPHTPLHALRIAKDSNHSQNPLQEPWRKGPGPAERVLGARRTHATLCRITRYPATRSGDSPAGCRDDEQASH